MATPFIYREAAPGQQAVQYAQLQEQADADRRRILAQTYHDMSTQGTEMARTNAQMAATRSQMNQRSAEAEKDRALQRERYKSAEAVAAGITKATEDAWARRDKAQADYETAAAKQQAEAFFQAGETDAAMMNDPKVPQALKDKIAAGRNVRPGPNGLWVNAHPNPALQLPGVQTIDDIKRRQAEADARNRALVTPVPSPGPRPPASTDFRVPTTPEPAPATPRTSITRDGWQSAPRPAPDVVVPRAPFSNTGRLRMGDDNLESPLRSYDFNSPTNGYREWFPPDYSWPPVDNDVRAHSTGPAPVRPMIDPQDGIRQNQMMQRAADLAPMRPPSTSGINPPRVGDFYYMKPDGTRGTGTNYPPTPPTMEWRPGMDEGQTLENLPDLSPLHPDSRLQYEILKGAFPPIAAENPYISTDIPPRGRMTVVPQQEILDANPEMLQTYDPPVRRMQVIRQSDILGVPRGYSPTWDAPGRRLPGTFLPY
jgi:hypothetical protein